MNIQTENKLKRINNYNQAPNTCKYCGMSILINPTQRYKDVIIKKNCSASCLSKFYHNQNAKRKNRCLNCNTEITSKKFCDRKCQKEFNDKQKIEKLKLTGDTGCSVKTTLRNAIRDYIYKKQNYKCAICGMVN